jgi:hypothetical protein
MVIFACFCLAALAIALRILLQQPSPLLSFVSLGGVIVAVTLGFDFAPWPLQSALVLGVLVLGKGSFDLG